MAWIYETIFITPVHLAKFDFYFLMCLAFIVECDVYDNNPEYNRGSAKYIYTYPDLRCGSLLPLKLAEVIHTIIATQTLIPTDSNNNAK